MRYWSIWDDQLLRALRGEFAAATPRLVFLPGEEGGVAVWSGCNQIGLWVAVGRQRFSFKAEAGTSRVADDIDILDMLAVNQALFSDLLSLVVTKPFRPVLVVGGGASEPDDRMRTA